MTAIKETTTTLSIIALYEVGLSGLKGYTFPNALIAYITANSVTITIEPRDTYLVTATTIINEIRHIHTIKYHSNIKRNEIPI